MDIVDSNIIIYAVSEENQHLMDLILNQPTSVSNISRLEVLGYHKMSDNQYRVLNEIFQLLNVIDVTPDIINRAIDLKREKKMSLGDSIIASTALERALKLVTRNTKYFSHIPGLQLINPFES